MPNYCAIRWCICICIRIRICMYICMCMYIYVYVYVCMYVCICMCYPMVHADPIVMILFLFALRLNDCVCVLPVPPASDQDSHSIPDRLRAYPVVLVAHQTACSERSLGTSSRAMRTFLDVPMALNVGPFLLLLHLRQARPRRWFPAHGLSNFSAPNI